MLMNVRQRIIAAVPQLATILLEPTNALAIVDFVAMGSRAEVFYHPSSILVLCINLCLFVCSFILFTDVDECSSSNGNCSAQATCNNTLGSYECTCNVGFIGNGYQCDGMLYLLLFLSCFLLMLT